MDSHIRLRGHKSETVSLLISISLSVQEYIEEKWDWDQKWDRLAFMAPAPEFDSAWTRQSTSAGGWLVAADDLYPATLGFVTRDLGVGVSSGCMIEPSPT